MARARVGMWASARQWRLQVRLWGAVPARWGRLLVRVRVLAPGWRRGSEVVVPPRVELVD